MEQHHDELKRAITIVEGVDPGADESQVLSVLKDNDVERMYCARALVLVRGLTVPEAKQAIHDCGLWAEAEARDDAMRDALIEELGFEEIESETGRHQELSTRLRHQQDHAGGCGPVFLLAVGGLLLILAVLVTDLSGLRDSWLWLAIGTLVFAMGLARMFKTLNR